MSRVAKYLEHVSHNSRSARATLDCNDSRLRLHSRRTERALSKVQQPSDHATLSKFNEIESMWQRMKRSNSRLSTESSPNNDQVMNLAQQANKLLDSIKQEATFTQTARTVNSQLSTVRRQTTAKRSGSNLLSLIQSSRALLASPEAP